MCAIAIGRTSVLSARSFAVIAQYRRFGMSLERERKNLRVKLFAVAPTRKHALESAAKKEFHTVSKAICIGI